MKLTNPVHQSIYNSVVKPAMDQKTFDLEAAVVGVNYYEQTVDVFWKDNDGRSRTVQGMQIPKDGDGIFREAVRIGDRVRVAFRNGNHNYPYISMIYDMEMNKSNFFSQKGASIPKGIGYM